MAKSQKKQQSIKPEKDNIVEEMLRELLSLKNLLGKYMTAHIHDLGPLDSAISSIKIGRRPDIWGYDVNRFIFKNLDLGKGISSENSFLEMTITISGSCKEPRPIHDLLDAYCLQFLLKQIESEEVELKNAFRFERHIYDDGDGNPDFFHPLYHFQSGGDKLTDDDDFDKGKVLFVDAPRVMHPPMDIVLAIDFVLGNFYSNKNEEIKKLYQDNLYHRIIEKAKKRFWRPYCLGLASNFTTNFNFLSESSIQLNKTFCQNIIFYKINH